MDIISEFIATYGVAILYAVLTGIAGFIGMQVKRLYEKYCNDKTKQDVAKTCVRAVEQLYHDLHGEEKYNKCCKSITEMLAEKGITISELEVKMLIESAVAEFNKAFEKNYTEESDEGYVEVEESPNQTALYEAELEEEKAPITIIAYEDFDDEGNPVPGSKTHSETEEE